MSLPQAQQEYPSNMDTLQVVSVALERCATNDHQSKDEYVTSTCASDLEYELACQIEKMGFKIVKK